MPLTHITDKSAPQRGLGLVWCPRTAWGNEVVPFLLISFVLEKLCFRETWRQTCGRLVAGLEIENYKLSYPEEQLLL